MVARKQKLRIIQTSLLLLGIMIIFFTYLSKDENKEQVIIPKSTQEKIKRQLDQEDKQGVDIFYNIEYSGLDLSGNRYILKSKEAFSDKTNKESVSMKSVEAIFYFKDNTVLYIWSNKAIYNNKTLDMQFSENVKAKYEGSELYAENAEYSNTQSFLKITNNVRIKDIRGNMIADELIFDIKDKKLNISSFGNNKINTKLKLNEKRF